MVAAQLPSPSVRARSRFWLLVTPLPPPPFLGPAPVRLARWPAPLGPCPRWVAASASRSLLVSPHAPDTKRDGAREPGHDRGHGAKGGPTGQPQNANGKTKEDRAPTLHSTASHPPLAPSPATASHSTPRSPAAALSQSNFAERPSPSSTRPFRGSNSRSSLRTVSHNNAPRSMTTSPPSTTTTRHSRITKAGSTTETIRQARG